MVVDHEERRRVFEASRSDAEAAQRLGLHVTTFQKWRWQQGLDSKNGYSERISAAEHERRLTAWMANPNNGEAARALGITHAAMEAWQIGQGLPSRTLLDFSEASKRRHELYLRAYNEATNDREAADLAGTSEWAFARWRRRTGLDPTSSHAKWRLAGWRERRRLAKG